MPHPHKFLAGRTAFQQLLLSRVPRTKQTYPCLVSLYSGLKSPSSSNRGDTKGITTWGNNPAVRTSLLGQRISQTHMFPSGFGQHEQIILDPQPVDPVEEAKLAFYNLKNDLQRRIFKLSVQTHQLVDAIQELIVINLLASGHIITEVNRQGAQSTSAIPIQLNTQPIASTAAILQRDTLFKEIENSISQEWRKEISEFLDNALFPLTLELYRTEKELKWTALYGLEVALAVSNRRIFDGLKEHPSLKPLALMANRKLKRQKDKLQWKFSAKPMQFDDHPLFHAVAVSAAKLHSFAREISLIRSHRGLERTPLPLRAESVADNYLYNFRNYSPSTTLRKKKPGQLRAWFEPVVNKKSEKLQDYSPKIIWTHAQERDGETINRFYSSRKAWDKNNKYFYDKESGQLRVNSPVPTVQPKARVTVGNNSRSLDDRRIYPELDLPKKNPAVLDTAPNPNNGSQIKRHPFDDPRTNTTFEDLGDATAPLESLSNVSNGLRIRRHPSNDYRIYPSNGGPRIKYHLSVDPRTNTGPSPMPLDQNRRFNTYTRINYHAEQSKKAKITRTGIPVRQRLVNEERDRKLAVIAILQGKAAAAAHYELKPEPMEEDEFVEALTGLARVADEDLTESTGMEFMEPGDLVELRGMHGGSELGVFIQPPLALNGDFLFLSETGKVKPWPVGCLPFIVSDYLSKPAVELLRNYLRQISDEEMISIPPRNLTKPLVDPIREFHKKALDVFAKKLPVLEKLYETFSHETETKVISTLEATAVVFPNGFQNHQVYAVHMALMADPSHFIADAAKQHRKSGLFEVRSRRDLKDLHDVTAWVRNKSGKRGSAAKGRILSDQLLSFTLKAQGLIDTHRALRTDEKELFTPIRSIPQPEYEWDENDKAIIRFLKCSTARVWFQESPYLSIVASILKAIGRYPKEPKYDHELAYHFLTEIGVYKPWENPFRYSYKHPLPHHGLSPRIDSMQDKMAEIDQDFQTGWEKLQLKDIMGPLRKEWKNQTIYAIDDASAEEIDDGISIEPISPSESWCHVHIANPTAFIPSDHWLAEAAREKLQTIYLPDQTYSMLPRSLSEFKFGLGSGRPVFSISGRVNNTTGELLEYKITPGVAKEVKRITYKNLNTAIGVQNKKPMIVIINRDPEAGNAEESKFTIGPDESTVLNKMRQLAVSIKKRRVRDGAMSFSAPSFRIKVDHGGQSQAPAEDIPVLYTGLPSIRFERLDALTEAHETVAEFMLLAGTIVAKFLNERSIPAPFRNNTISAREGSEVIFKNILLPSRNEFGLVPREIMRQNLSVMGTSRIQSQRTTGHVLLGLHSGYLKATSPLRRYLDMVVHWQIERALLNEYNCRPANENLPFSKEYLDKNLPRMEVKERQLNLLQTESEKFWIWRMLQWGRLEGQAKKIPNKLPKLTVELSSKNEWPIPCVGLLTEFAVPMKVFFKSREEWEKAHWGEIGLVEFDDETPNKIRLNMRWVGK